MSQQLALGEGFEKYARTTKRAQFLSDVDRIIPWSNLCGLVAPLYPVAGAGRPPRELEMMLRFYFLQQWFNLSDPAVEEALHDSATFYSFAGLGLAAGPAPDEATARRISASARTAQAGQDAAEHGERVLAPPGDQDHARHHRGSHDHQRTVFDEEQEGRAGSGDAPDGEREAVVLRDEGAHRRGQCDQARAYGAGVGRERRRQGRFALSASRQQDAVIGRLGVPGTKLGHLCAGAECIGLYEPAFPLRGHRGRGREGEESQQVAGRGQARARVRRDQGRVRLSQGALARTG